MKDLAQPLGIRFIKREAIMCQWKIYFLLPILMGMLLSTQSSAQNQSLHLSQEPFSLNELNTIKQYLFNNIMTSDHVVIKENEGRVIHSMPGAVLASPSNKAEFFTQDYQFHWIRDAALTMNEVALLYSTSSLDERKQLKPYLINYINFEQQIQQQTLSKGQSLGEPKYNIDGTLWQGQWARPQNDGPALRAITMMAIANLLVKEGDEKLVQEKIRDMITTDLDYVASKWQEFNYDLWEEVGDQDHFFTKMVGRRALREGAEWVKQFADPGRAEWYLSVANQMTTSLQKHWNDHRGYFTETISQQFFKGGGMDSAIILGVLYGNIEDPNDPFAINNERVLSSIYFIRSSFVDLYRVNIDRPGSPPLVGRYPNDAYDGGQFNYGNPWILNTAALAEYYYALAYAYLKQGEINITKENILFFQQVNSSLNQEKKITLSAHPGQFYTIINDLMNEGDHLLQRMKEYAVCYADGSCNHFSEQIDRTSGEQVSAKDLTWGYASLLSAMQMRTMAQNELLPLF